MSNISQHTFKEIITVVVPFCQNPMNRETWIRSALLGCSVLNHIDWTGSAQVFTERLLHQLLLYGDCESDQSAITLMLNGLLQLVGKDKQAYIHTLIQHLEDAEIQSKSVQIGSSTTIFISYARVDGSEAATKLESLLPQHGFNVWRDNRNLDPTRDFTAEIELAIRKSSHVVCCITSDVQRNDSFVRREISFAQALNKPIIVARFDDVIPPVTVINNTWLDFFREWDAQFLKLCQMLSSHTGFETIASLQPDIQADVAENIPQKDPFVDYLHNLYEQIVTDLQNTVFLRDPNSDQTSIIEMSAEDTKSSVQNVSRTVGMSYLSRKQSPEESGQIFQNFSDAFEKHKGRILLLGDPGMGKTITLLAFTRDAIASRLMNLDEPLPIFVPIAEWNDDERPNLAQWLEATNPTLTGKIKDLLETGQALLILDGLDELGGEKLQESPSGKQEKVDPRKLFMNLLPHNNQVIISCRTKDYDDIGKKLSLNGGVTLKPLSDAQLKSLIGSDTSLWQRLENDDDLRTLARNPLLLTLLSYSHEKLSERLESDNPEEIIIENYFKSRYQYDADKNSILSNLISLNSLYHILYQVVMKKVGQPNDSFYLVDDFADELPTGVEGNTFIRWLIELNILRKTDDDKYRFAHLLMRDHVALFSIRNEIQRQPKMITHHIEYGRTLTLLNRVDEALTVFEEALQINKISNLLWLHYGDALVIAERYDDAITAFARVMLSDPQNADVLLKLGQVYRLIGEYEEALTMYTRVTEMTPEDKSSDSIIATAWNGRALTLKSQNRVLEALENYEKACALDPQNPWYVINQVNLLFRMKRFPDIFMILEKAIQYIPQNALLWARRGRVLHFLKRYDEALDCFENAIQLENNYEWAWLRKAASLERLERYDEALPIYEHVLKNNNDNGIAWGRLGRLHYRLGNIKEAESALNKGLELRYRETLSLYLNKLLNNVPFEDLKGSKVSTGSFGDRGHLLSRVDQMIMMHTKESFLSISYFPEVDFDFPDSSETTEMVSETVFDWIMNEELSVPIVDTDSGEIPKIREDDEALADTVEAFEGFIEPESIPQASPKTSATINSAQDFDIGEMIEGRYEVADVKLGGMGIVYLCYDHDHHEPVAIKSFQRRFLDNERAVRRFSQEAVTWIKIEKHPNIVHARLVRNINARPHIILEHISGMENMGADLRSWIDSKRLTLCQTLVFATHIALGMKHATEKVEGLVHRDLKPGNIMVTHDGIAKITDFGLVRSVDWEKLTGFSEEDLFDESQLPEYRLTRMDAVVGTPPYMSPEQIRAHNVDHTSDIYAYGIILYEMLVGRHPFRARGVNQWRDAHLNQAPAFPPSAINEFPDTITELVLACLEKRSSDRPQSWHEIVDKLLEIYETECDGSIQTETGEIELEARELINMGYSLTELGRYSDALKSYDQAIALQPDYAWAWGRKGRTYRLLNQYEEALECYDKALELNANDAWSWNGKGIILERMNRLEEALEHFKKATDLDPTNMWHWYNQGNIFKELGRDEEALTMVERALAIDENHANSWGKLGQIYRSMGKFRESIPAYKKATSLQSDYAWAWNGYGLSLKALGQLDEAIHAFKKAIRFQPDMLWHWYNLTESLVDTNRFYEALEPAQEAVRINPNHVPSWGKLGQIQRKLNRLDEALVSFNRAVELDPEFDWAWNGHGLTLENMERYDDALESYRKAAEIKPEREWYWNNQGNALLLLERYEEAVDVLMKAKDLNPDYALSWMLLSSAYRHLGKYKEAIENAQKATDIVPNYARAWSEMATSYEAVGNYEGALSAYAHATEYAQDKPTYLYKQADVLVILERYPEALNLLDEAIELDDRASFLWAKHGQVLRKMNRPQEALNSYNRAVEFDPNYAWAWSGRGITLNMLGRHIEALECFKRTVQIDKTDVWYWYNYGDELVARQQYEEALDVFDEAITLDENHAESWSKIGQAHRSLGRYEEARKAYEKALELKPDFGWAWNGYGLTLKSMGLVEESLTSYRNAVQHNPEVIWYHINLMTALLDLGRREEALITIERALEVNPNDAKVWARHGQVLRRLEKYEQAIVSYERALAIEHDYAWAWNGKGMSLTALGQHADAADCYRQAVKYDARDVWFWHNYGDVLSKIGKVDEARNAFEHALEIDPNHEPSRAKLNQIDDE